MTIGIANDHRGVKRKKEIIKFLEKEIYAVEQGYLKLRQQLSNWIVKNEKTDFS